MNDFCYSKELYNKGICTLDNIKEFSRIVNQINRIEKLLNPNTSCNDELKEIIIFSYYYKKHLTDFDRINFIKGIIYAKHYIDEDDIKNFNSEINFYNKFFEDKNQSIYKCINYYHDIEFYTLDQILDNQEYIPTSNEPDNDEDDDEEKDDDKEKLYSNIAFKDDEEDVNDLVKDTSVNDNVFDNFFEDLNIRKLEPNVKLDTLKLYFEEYIDLIFQMKKIYSDREKKYVRKGMYFWFDQIYHELNCLYKISEIERKTLDKSLYKAF